MSRTIFSQASLDQEIQNIPVLLAQGQHGGQNAPDQKAALSALRAETPFSPQHAPVQRAFGGIIGWLGPLILYKRPQGWFDFEDIGTGFVGEGLIGQYADCQQRFDLAANGSDQQSEFCPGQCAISEAMPMAKQKGGLLEQQPADHLRLPTPLKDGLKIPFEMRPTHLPRKGSKPV